MNIEQELGICIKNLEKKVLTQNNLCLKICGNLINQVCEKNCMEKYYCETPVSQLEGMILFKNINTEEGPTDSVVINNGETITTIFYPHKKREELIAQELEELKALGLTKSEICVFEKVLRGEKNKEIAKSLFISEATLKTHLNNIYKKIPERWHRLRERK